MTYFYCLIIITISLHSFGQSEDCSRKVLNQLGEKFVDSLYNSPNKEAWLYDTTRIDAADHLSRKFEDCLAGRKMRFFIRLMGKGNILSGDNLQSENCTYQLEYILRTYGPNGEPINEFEIPSSLYISFDKRKRATHFYIISY